MALPISDAQSCPIVDTSALPAPSHHPPVSGLTFRTHWPLPADPLGAIYFRPEHLQANPELLSRFESLGDNCEFGFIQRFHGCEPSSLLRWATAPLDGVMTGLKDQWANLYAWENLMPWAGDMVWDDHYRCAFHSTIHSNRSDENCPLTFVLPETERLQAWAVERPKIIHLRDKTLASLNAAEHIFVVKCNDGFTIDQILSLRDALAHYNSNNKLLCVVSEEKIAARGLLLISANIKLAVIPELASYMQVELAHYGAWTNIVRLAHGTPWQ